MKNYKFAFALKTFFFAMLAFTTLGIGFESQAHAFGGFTGVDILDYFLEGLYCWAYPMMGCE